MISSNVSSADGNNAGLWIELDAILAVVIGGTSLAGGRFSLGGTVLGALIIQTLTTTIYTDRRPARDDAAVQGARGRPSSACSSRRRSARKVVRPPPAAARAAGPRRRKQKVEVPA